MNDLGQCQETAGFLFSHHCEDPAVATCEECGKAVCSDHAATTYTDSTHETVLCTTCAKKRQRSDTDSVRYENDPYYYSIYYYDDYYYDEHDFNESDEAVLTGGHELNESESAEFEDDMRAS